jgi:hypothetical protein
MELQTVTDVATRRLAELEAVIEAGLQTFVEVGAALLEIRDGRLYRETHASFEAYCRERWNFTGRRGRQLIAAAEVGTVVPIENEAQARELAPLLDDPDQLRLAWAEALTNGAPTAAKVREAVERHITREKTPEQQQRETAIHVTLAIADAIRYLDLPADRAAPTAAMFTPAAAGIGGEDWTQARLERAADFLAALIDAWNGG